MTLKDTQYDIPTQSQSVHGQKLLIPVAPICPSGPVQPVAPGCPGFPPKPGGPGMPTTPFGPGLPNPPGVPVHPKTAHINYQ